MLALLHVAVIVLQAQERSHESHVCLSQTKSRATLSCLLLKNPTPQIQAQGPVTGHARLFSRSLPRPALGGISPLLYTEP
ncbi:hypothetical protein FKM82_029489 [Ascaphus truei]